MTPPAAEQRLGTTSLEVIGQALAAEGLWLDVGAARIRVQSHLPSLATQLQAVYADFALVGHSPWADVHCQLEPVAGLRRWIRPQVTFWSDGQLVFEPFAANAPLPLFEWGCNWLIGQRRNDRLLLHAGALERDGLALLLPATPGSGKSTLTAALTQRGWRLLSDEFGVLDTGSGQIHAMLKPVALKNRSIDVIRQFAPQARLGPSFPGTRKGTVAHLAADRDAVMRRHQSAPVGAVVLPRWEAGHATSFKPLTPEHAFAALAFNSFNYQLIGAPAFEAVLAIARGRPAWQLVYSDLDAAIATLNDAWSNLRERP